MMRENNNFNPENVVLEDIVKVLSFIKIEFIDRKEFNKLSGDYLKEINNKEYILYLPNDLKDEEKIHIYKYLESNFSTNSNEKLKNFMSYLLIKNFENHNIKLDIEKVYKLLFNKQVIQLKELKKQLKKLSLKEKLEIKRQWIYLLKKYKNGEKLENIIKYEISYYFEEIFFNIMKKYIINNLKGFTKSEYNRLQKRKVKKGEKINFRLNDNLLPEKEILIKDLIGLDKYKEKLEQARRDGNIEYISQLEYEVTSKIIEVLYNYFPYQYTKENYGYQPSKILETKEIYCVGFSILGHIFLDELGIKHKGLGLPIHSVLEVNIGGKKYLFDAAKSSKLEEIRYIKNGKITYLEKIGKGEKIKVFSFPDNPSRVLLSQIYTNRGSYWSRVKQENNIAEKNYKKSIYLKENLETYANFSNVLAMMGENEKAIYFLEKAIEGGIKEPMHYYNFGALLFAKGEKERAIEIFKVVLEKLDNYDEVFYYFVKSNIFGYLGNEQLEYLYYYVYNLLIGKENEFNINSQIAEEINKLISIGDLVQLAEYLKSIEELLLQDN